VAVRGRPVCVEPLCPLCQAAPHGRPPPADAPAGDTLAALPPDEEAVSTFLAESEATMVALINETHHTFLDLRLGRAHALHASGAPPRAVLRELWMAARTYADNADLYLAKWPPERVRSRRLLPLELALIVGDPDVLSSVKAHMTLDVMILLAHQEQHDVTAELDHVTPWFARRRLSDPYDLAGTLAILYGCALSGILQGEPTNLKMALATAALLTDEYWIMLRNPKPGLARVVAALQALRALRPASPGAFVRALAAHGEAHDKSWAAAAREDPNGPARARGMGSLDTGALALIMAGDALGMDVKAALDAAPQELALETPRRYIAALLDA